MIKIHAITYAPHNVEKQAKQWILRINIEPKTEYGRMSTV